jgi:hypothetical protein
MFAGVPFAQGGNPNLYLPPGSPAIDAGDPATPPGNWSTRTTMTSGAPDATPIDMGTHYAFSDSFDFAPPSGGNVVLSWTLSPQQAGTSGGITCAIDHGVGAVDTTTVIGSISTAYVSGTTYTLDCTDGTEDHLRTLTVP